MISCFLYGFLFGFGLGASCASLLSIRSATRAALSTSGESYED